MMAVVNYAVADLDSDAPVFSLSLFAANADACFQGVRKQATVPRFGRRKYTRSDKG